MSDYWENFPFVRWPHEKYGPSWKPLPPLPEQAGNPSRVRIDVFGIIAECEHGAWRYSEQSKRWTAA